jgi:hypothetical protein
MLLDPDTETPARLCDRARIICRGVLRLFDAHDYACVRELPLANGRRADIVALGPRGEITIVEVKSGLADLRADGKWPDYGPFCDRFYFAVDADFPREALPETTGLIIADGFGGAVLREADPTPLAAARRKAMTLRFARAAARKLLAS